MRNSMLIFWNRRISNYFPKLRKSLNRHPLSTKKKLESSKRFRIKLENIIKKSLNDCTLSKDHSLISWSLTVNNKIKTWFIINNKFMKSYIKKTYFFQSVIENFPYFFMRMRGKMLRIFGNQQIKNYISDSKK